MAKVKTTFFCQNCGTQHTQWVGQCSNCKQWNTIVEEVLQKEEKRNWKTLANKEKRKATPLRVEERKTIHY
jgi:DNA repair protein RadA/Sms